MLSKRRVLIGGKYVRCICRSTGHFEKKIYWSPRRAKTKVTKSRRLCLLRSIVKMLKCSEVNVTIRRAVEEDMVKVFKLIKDLAEFEKLENQVKISADTLAEDGFHTEHPAFTCLVAELTDGHIMGYALYYVSYSTWLGKSILLEDLYVQPAYRKMGVGKQLFMAVAKIAHEMPAKRLDFHVLSWNPAGDFYKSLGAENLTISEKWQLFRLNEDALNKMFSR